MAIVTMKQDIFLLRLNFATHHNLTLDEKTDSHTYWVALLVIIYRCMCLNRKGAEFSWLLEQVRRCQICEPLWGLWAIPTVAPSLLNNVSVWKKKNNSLLFVKWRYQPLSMYISPQWAYVHATCVRLNGQTGYTAVMPLGVVLHNSDGVSWPVAVDYTDPCYTELWFQSFTEPLHDSQTCRDSVSHERPLLPLRAAPDMVHLCKHACHHVPDHFLLLLPSHYSDPIYIHGAIYGSTDSHLCQWHILHVCRW